MSDPSGELIKIPGEGDLIGGQFLLENEIGRGGFGIVFRARQLGVERPVAVKMLMPHAMTHEGVVERFKREARLASSLTHPNSVTIYAYGVHKPTENVRGLPYIAMEHLVGQTLQQYHSEHGQLDIEETIDIVKQTLSSLAEAHNKGIIHRDIKPENIFLVQKPDHNREIKVLDFGIAKAVAGDWDPETRERLTRTGLIAGTAEYMAPEQATGVQDITPALDIYAMGCIAFQLVTGDVPYKGNSPMEIAIKHISEPIPVMPEELRGHFIERVITKAMAKEPRDRFQDAEKFVEILERGVLDDADLPAPTPVPDASPATLPPVDDGPVPGAGPPMWLFGVVAALLLLTVGLLGYVLIFDDDPVAEAPVATAAAPTDDPGGGDDTNAQPAGAEAEADPEAAEPLPSTNGAAPEEAEGPAMADSITLQAEPTADVFRDGDAIGKTPLVLARSKLGDAPFEVELRAADHAPESITIDWTATPESGSIQASLRPRKPESAQGNKGQAANLKAQARAARRKRSRADGANRRRRRKAGKSPALFDLGAGSKKKEQERKKGSPTLFAP